MAAVSSATGGAALWGYFFVHGQVNLAYASMQQLFVFMFICAAVRRFVFLLFPQGFSRSQKSRFGPFSGDVFTSPTQQSPSPSLASKIRTMML